MYVCWVATDMTNTILSSRVRLRRLSLVIFLLIINFPLAFFTHSRRTINFSLFSSLNYYFYHYHLQNAKFIANRSNDDSLWRQNATISIYVEEYQCVFLTLVGRRVDHFDARRGEQNRTVHILVCMYACILCEPEHAACMRIRSESARVCMLSVMIPESASTTSHCCLRMGMPNGGKLVAFPMFAHLFQRRRASHHIIIRKSNATW